jgi:hypothetical protein
MTGEAKIDEEGTGMSEHLLEGRFFAVGEDPYCVWDWDLRDRNVQYLQSLDPRYFDYVARANFAYLDAEDTEERRRAATAIRAAYHHGLESFFALLFATLQAPDCHVGWMQIYMPANLRNVVKALDPMLAERGDDRDRARHRHAQLLQHLKIRPRATWEGVSATVNLVPGDDEERAKRVRVNFANLWRGFAKDFVNQNFTDEYNSIKHGLRAGSGGFDMAIGLQASEDEPAPPEAMHWLGGSEHGSSFYMARAFVERPTQSERKPRFSGRNRDLSFRVRRHHLNWDPRGLCTALSLISVSIHNVRTFALAINGIGSGLQFLTPADEGFSMLLGQPGGLQASNMDALVFKADIELLNEDQIRLEIQKESEVWTRRAGKLLR